MLDPQQHQRKSTLTEQLSCVLFRLHAISTSYEDRYRKLAISLLQRPCRDQASFELLLLD